MFNIFNFHVIEQCPSDTYNNDVSGILFLLRTDLNITLYNIKMIHSGTTFLSDTNASVSAHNCFGVKHLKIYSKYLHMLLRQQLVLVCH